MEQVAERVWKITGGFPRKVMHVYLIEEDDGITVFDAGIRSMKTQILGAVASLGRLKRIVLGHAPKSVWAGHGQPITEDVQGQLLLAAER